MSTTVEKEAMFVRAGDSLHTQTNLPIGEGPMSFAINRDRTLRHLIRDAGYPREVLVTSVSRVPDEPSDIALVLDFGVGTYSLELHRERVVQVTEEEGR